MVNEIKFQTNTDLTNGLLELLKRLETSLDLKQPIQMYIAGGMAAHLYTGARVTMDVDAEFSKRIIVPSDLLVETKGGQVLYLDTNYNSTFALMHEDYIHDAIKVPVDSHLIEVYVLSPVDLIVSKIARLSGPDREDIESIIKAQRVTAEEIEKRANEAMAGYIGNHSNVLHNLSEVLKIARGVDELAPPCDNSDDDEYRRPSP